MPGLLLQCVSRQPQARRRGEGGFTLLEMLVAVAILGLVGVGIMAALGTGFRSQDITREQVRAENLVRGALEEIRNQTYLASYTLTVPVPSGYSIAVDTQPYCLAPDCQSDDNIQKNTVTVSRDGKHLVTIEDLKTRR